MLRISILPNKKYISSSIIGLYSSYIFNILLFELTIPSDIFNFISQLLTALKI